MMYRGGILLIQGGLDMNDRPKKMITFSTPTSGDTIFKRRFCQQDDEYTDWQSVDFQDKTKPAFMKFIQWFMQSEIVGAVFFSLLGVSSLFAILIELAG